jgi:L-ornithine N5-oxygenase
MPYDCVGVGFGPANMSLAISLAESHFATKRFCFLESRPSYCWHAGLLFPASTMQVSFLKDLVTTENPTSPFTFLNFLHETGRLHKFINLRTFYPRRMEFNDYLRWVAGKFDKYTHYGCHVVDIEPVKHPGAPGRVLRISYRRGESGRVDELLTRNVVIADGGVPRIPLKSLSRRHPRIFHASDTLDRLKNLQLIRDTRAHFHIVGSGQSAADVFTYLASTYDQSRITLTHRGFALRPEEDTHFINELFLPRGLELFSSLDQPRRDELLSEHWHATHSGVTAEMIPKIYEEVYADSVAEVPRLALRNFSELVDAEESGDAVLASVRETHTGEVLQVPSDVLILATGFDRPCPHPLLTRLSGELTTLADGKAYDLDANWRIKPRRPCAYGVFMQGYRERTHGFSEIVLSLMPKRARAIACAL